MCTVTATHPLFPCRVSAFFNAKIPIQANFLNLQKHLVFSVFVFFMILHILLVPKMQKKISPTFLKYIRNNILSVS